MSPAILFIVGFVVFLPVFVAALSFAYSEGVRIDRAEEEPAEPARLLSEATQS